MKKIKWLKPLLIAFTATAVIGLVVVAYQLNMPHRDVQSSQTDYSINFKNGKPASNIAKTIEITFKGDTKIKYWLMLGW